MKIYFEFNLVKLVRFKKKKAHEILNPSVIVLVNICFDKFFLIHTEINWSFHKMRREIMSDHFFNFKNYSIDLKMTLKEIL